METFHLGATPRMAFFLFFSLIFFSDTTVAQLAERGIVNADVAGSSPVSGSSELLVSSMNVL